MRLPLHYDFMDLRYTPEGTKEYFKKNGWTTIIGFQTRNPLHRSHYELTRFALKEVGEDAKLLLHPSVGVTQDCDIDYHTRVRCYKKLMDKYPEDTVLLSLLPLSMRMAGPREAVWHALIRKNYGCTHFIVGRDHAGPSYKKKDGSPFYGPYEAHELLTRLEGKIGIKIVMSPSIVYVKELCEYRRENEVSKDMTVLNISGTEQRDMLSKEVEIPEWFSWKDIIEELRNEFKVVNNKGMCIYLVGLSGSGKSTMANVLINKLKEMGVSKKITLLDADVVRLNLSKGLGFSKEDRSTNVRRIGYVASEIVNNGGIVICANIAPYEADRLFNRKQISSKGKYIEVYMKTSLECCIRRDVKGLYKLALEGKVQNFTGVNDPFEEPLTADVVLDGDDMNVEISENVDKILDLIRISN
jgi:sulfate adenylyltransferase